MIKKNIISIVVVFLTLISYAQETVSIKDAKYSIERLNENVNTDYSNFGTTFYGEDKIVFASPTKKKFIIRNNWKGNHQPFLDLYIGTISEGGQLRDVQKFSENLSTRYHEADVTFTKDKKTVYFTRNNYLDKKYKKDSTGINLLQLYRAKIAEDGEWEDIESMPFNSDQYSTGHPTLSADERTLYFISNMPGSLGKTDVFKASISEDGAIGNPINMGSKINTAEREMFSSISGNDELYFSSDGRPEGLGGLDLYVVKLNGDEISEPINLGAPINSERDDFSFIINYETRRGYFSSNREGGSGDDDIYTFVQELPIVFECEQIVQGVVIDKKTGALIPGALVVLSDGKELNRQVVGQDATYSFEIECNKNYKVVASKQGYSQDERDFFSTEGKELKIPLALKKDYVPEVPQEFEMTNGKCVVRINPIYFDFDKSYIRPDAALELDKVISVMRKYPDLIIEGGSHTDSRGSFKYNEALSSRRARSTVDYIISKGISSSKISSRGYGERQLVNGCADGVRCSEEEHQFNRRTEFVIVNYNQIKEKYPEICSAKTTSTRSQIEQGVKIVVNPKLAEQRKIESYDSTFKVTKDGNILVRINPIYFDLNRFNIRPDAERELNKVVEVMIKYPDLIIEGGSHTDSRASDSYNNNLSSNRAKSTVDYIISRGVHPSRITAKGYGETQLTNHCSDGVECSKEQHQVNRRTEFKILNPEVINK